MDEATCLREQTELDVEVPTSGGSAKLEETLDRAFEDASCCAGNRVTDVIGSFEVRPCQRHRIKYSSISTLGLRTVPRHMACPLCVWYCRTLSHPFRRVEDCLPDPRHLSMPRPFLKCKWLRNKPNHVVELSGLALHPSPILSFCLKQQNDCQLQTGTFFRPVMCCADMAEHACFIRTEETCPKKRSTRTRRMLPVSPQP